MVVNLISTGYLVCEFLPADALSKNMPMTLFPHLNSSFALPTHIAALARNFNAGYQM
jgi:F0F1-type ATP synthase beta subunit